MQLLQDENEDNNNVQVNNQQQQPQMLVTRYTTLLKLWRQSCIFFLGYFPPIIIAIVAVLAVEWNNVCDSQLRTWLLVLACLHVVQFVLYIITLYGLPKLTDTVFLQEIKIGNVLKFYACSRVLDLFWFGWYILGAAWTFTDSCSQQIPNIWKMSLSLFILQSVLMCCFVCCFCLNCARIIHEAAIILNEPQAHGLDQKTIDKLRSESFSSMKGDIKKEDAVCAICLMEYEEDENIAFLPCKHHYHKDCITPWLLKNDLCPYCKKAVEEKQQQV